MANKELTEIITKFAESGWDVLDAPAKKWLKAQDDKSAKAEMVAALEQADKDCGSCGCEYDPLYKKALELLRAA